ncbi:MAG: PRD domain-containing protein [Coprobacillus sp.]|nr:PRD domain-containing protein [Coprobacillus sp.]
MKISQILNNNVAVVKRGSNEVIVYSKGISFLKKVGDEIYPEEIQKTYVLDSHDKLEHFSYLLSNTKDEYLQIVNQIIEYGEEVLKEKMYDYLSLTLLDHIDFTIRRMKKGQFIGNPLSYQVKKFYPLHYQIGLFGIRLIQQYLSIDCPEDEGVAIALHFINIQSENKMEESIQVMDTVKDILAIIKYHFQKPFDENSINYVRLVTHIQYFAHRLVHNEWGEEQENEFYQQIYKSYPQAYYCVQKIRKYVKDVFKCDLTHDEEVYLILHIHRVFDRSIK